MTQQNTPTHVRDLLDTGPRNWGRWGPDDEVGALNHLTTERVLAGRDMVRTGKTFTLGVPIGRPGGDPLWPGRAPAQRYMVQDRGTYLAGAGLRFPGGAEGADDVMTMPLQGSTQYDALGHMWYDDQLWNGYSASTTAGGLRKASVQPIAERGIVGRGVLIDVARHRGKDVLGRGETFTHEDLHAAADQQGVEIRPGDILLIRTGWIGSFYSTPAEEFYRDFLEPGLTYSPELVQWFADLEIPNLATDTIANEVTADPVTGFALPLHLALMRNLGIAFAEILALDALAEDCAQDGQWDFLYTAGPLKVVHGTGAPVNPVAIK